MSDTVETFHGKHGLVATLEYDSDCSQPYEDDEGVRIVVLARHHIDPSEGACGSDPEEVAAWAAENAADWYVAPLFMYEHSGVAFRTSAFSDAWDSGQVGIVAVKRGEWYGPNATDADYAKAAASVADEYGRWANGECYGYVVKDAEGEHLDSCWGFIGMEYAEEEAKATLKRCEDFADTEAARELEASRPDMYGDLDRLEDDGAPAGRTHA